MQKIQNWPGIITKSNACVSLHVPTKCFVNKERIHSAGDRHSFLVLKPSRDLKKKKKKGWVTGCIEQLGCAYKLHCHNAGHKQRLTVQFAQFKSLHIQYLFKTTRGNVIRVTRRRVLGGKNVWRKQGNCIIVIFYSCCIVGLIYFCISAMVTKK